MSKYFKNFILCGDIDHHCLLCRESFQTIDDLEKHIRWEKHRKSLKGMSCMPKFKKDSIFKVDDKYYCEHCNRVISTVAAVSEHIQEAKHQENKGNPPTELRSTVCKRESGFIVIGKIKITNKEWYGVIDGKCVFCNDVVDNFVKHISTSSHMINMIQSEILTNENQYYRMINKENSYCFFCKQIFPAHSLNDHWAENLHLEKVQAQIENRDTKADQAKKLDVAIKLINSQKDYFDIDLENKVAMCKICTAYVNINFKFMIEHKKIHNITAKDKIEQAPVDMDEVIESLKLKKPQGDDEVPGCWFDHGKKRAELAAFGREHFIKLVFPGGKGYCSLCGTYISAHMKNFTEHVKGQIHMGHLELKGLDKSVRPHAKPTYKTKTLKEYLRSVIYSKELEVLWINKHFSMEIFCFMLVSVIEGNGQSRKIKCYACDVIYNHDKIGEHCMTEKHKEVFLNSQVVTSIKDELIREIHPNLYHCGICNLTFPFWETLEKHLFSWKHVFTKDERRTMNNLAAQRYAALASPNLNHDRVYSYLMSLGIL